MGHEALSDALTPAEDCGFVPHGKQMRQGVCPACGVRSSRWRHVGRNLTECPACGHVCAPQCRKRLTPAEHARVAEERRQRRRERDAANREHLNAYSRDWRARHRDLVNMRQRAKYKRMTPEQREKARERDRKYYRANRDRIRERKKAWERANPDKMYVYRKKTELKRLRKEKARVSEANPTENGA